MARWAKISPAPVPSQPRPRLIAGVATIPGRPLEGMLRSIRHQVDECYVYLNGFTEVPEVVRELNCQYILDPVNRGAERKLWWADKCGEGVYFTMDDDLRYPSDYCTRLLGFLESTDWRGIVGVHARRYEGAVQEWQRWAAIYKYQRELTKPQWVNLLGTATTAFHTSLGVPSKWKGLNCADAQLAVWAQKRGVPMLAVSRPPAWLTYLGTKGTLTVFTEDAERGFIRRNTLMQSIPDWRIFV